jgi:hypothetical protein
MVGGGQENWGRRIMSVTTGGFCGSVWMSASFSCPNSPAFNFLCLSVIVSGEGRASGGVQHVPSERFHGNLRENGLEEGKIRGNGVEKRFSGIAE